MTPVVPNTQVWDCAQTCSY